MTEILFPSEQSGIPITKESPSIDSGIQFHTHNGLDNSPRIDEKNMTNSVNGGKYVGQATLLGGFSSTSTSYEDTGLAITASISGDRNTGSRNVLLMFAGQISHNTAGEIVYLTFDIDGITQGELIAAVLSATPATLELPTSMVFVASVSPGSHTFKVQMKINTGIGYLGKWSGNKVVFSIIELST